jgi:hypothetical protein
MTLQRVTIREFSMADYDDVTALWELSGLGYRPDGRDGRENIGRETANGRSLFLVAEAEGCLVGVVIGTHDGRKGWINRLAVHPAFHVASRLVAATEEWLAEAGIDVVACLIDRGERGLTPGVRAAGLLRGHGHSLLLKEAATRSVRAPRIALRLSHQA